VGRPVAVDVESLEHPHGPIKMEFGCQVPVQIQEYVTLFVNMQGFKIRIMPITKLNSNDQMTDPPPLPTQDRDEDKEEEQYETDEDRWDGHRGRHNDKGKPARLCSIRGKGGPTRKSVPSSAPTEAFSPACPLLAAQETIRTRKSRSRLLPLTNMGPISLLKATFFLQWPRSSTRLWAHHQPRLQGSLILSSCNSLPHVLSE
jgi:hypothetical protein